MLALGPVGPEVRVRYLELLARFYILYRQHLLAAQVLAFLAEQRQPPGVSGPSDPAFVTLERR